MTGTATPTREDLIAAERRAWGPDEFRIEMPESVMKVDTADGWWYDVAHMVWVWDPLLHPRGPGGKFASVGDDVKAARKAAQRTAAQHARLVDRAAAGKNLANRMRALSDEDLGALHRHNIDTAQHAKDYTSHTHVGNLLGVELAQRQATGKPKVQPKAPVKAAATAKKTVPPKATPTRTSKAPEGYGLNGPVKDTEPAVHRHLSRYHNALAYGRHAEANKHLRLAAATTNNRRLAASLAAAADKPVPADLTAADPLDTPALIKHSGLRNKHTNAADEAERVEKEAAKAAQPQHLAQLRADAAKPGRAGQQTKREEYAASWDYQVRQAQKALDAAKARGDQASIARAEENLRYNQGARDDILNKVDPELDQLAGGGTPAQALDPARPLAVYGDMLHLEGDDQWIHDNAANLEQIPAELHGAVAKHMASIESGGIWIGEGGVSSLNHSDDLQGAKPRGWGDGKTFDDVNGVYRPGQRVLIVGRTENSKGRGAKTASHEFGHALDFALGTQSHGSDWAGIHQKAVDAADHRLSPYFRQPGDAGREEFWAEAFQVWSEARQLPGAAARQDQYEREFGVPANLADRIHDYFDQIHDEVVRG